MAARPSGFKRYRAENPSPGVYVDAMADEKQGKKEEGKPQEKQSEGKGSAGKKPAHMKQEKVLSSIVRLAGKDVNGSLNMQRALAEVRGIGSNLSHALTLAAETKLNIPHTTNLGSLSEDQMEQLEKLIKSPAQYGIPIYMLNRRKDMETGKDIHYVSNELLFSTRQDVNRDVGLRLWRGFRHQYGQKVRGQRTRSTGRKGATIGVMKKGVEKGGAAQPEGKAAGAAVPAKKEEKPAAPAAAAK